nr:MAG TPA: hypothetical protein [Caudoviricetes sp.]
MTGKKRRGGRKFPPFFFVDSKTLTNFANA